MNEHINKYQKDIPLIDKEGWKQILVYTLA
jgi:hypothetical protein